MSGAGTFRCGAEQLQVCGGARGRSSRVVYAHITSNVPASLFEAQWTISVSERDSLDMIDDWAKWHPIGQVKEELSSCMGARQLQRESAIVLCIAWKTVATLTDWGVARLVLSTAHRRVGAVLDDSGSSASRYLP